MKSWLAGAAAISLAAACAAGAVRRDLTDDYDPDGGRLCEVAIGTARSALPQGRIQLRYPEGIEEERLIVPLCGGSIDAELSFDEAGRVAHIVVAEDGICLHGLCIGDLYGDASKNPHVRPFFTQAEGGMLALMRPELGIGYAVRLGRLPVECLDGPRPCSRADRLRLEAIILSRPGAE